MVYNRNDDNDDDDDNDHNVDDHNVDADDDADDGEGTKTVTILRRAKLTAEKRSRPFAASRAEGYESARLDLGFYFFYPF